MYGMSLDVYEARVVDKQRVFHDGGLDEDDHVPLADEPLDERDEGWDDGGVAHLLDDQHAQGRLVPRQPLRSRILDRPTKTGRRVNSLEGHVAR